MLTTVHEAMAECPGPSLPVDSGASASDTELESGESGDPGFESSSSSQTVLRVECIIIKKIFGKHN